MLLLDTCTLIWLASDPEQLSDVAVQQLNDDRNQLYISDVSALEIGLKWNAGKIRLPTPPRRWFEGQRQTWGLSSLPLRREDIYRSTELPEVHRDPFDRLLVAQALEADLVIVTPDVEIQRYPIATLW
jgi:PIN domain nuclease of toxin-antitoxin system